MKPFRVSHTILVTLAVSRSKHLAHLAHSNIWTGNYLIIIAGLAIYSLFMNPTLLIALVFLIGGFTLINRYGTSMPLLIMLESRIY